MNTNRIAFVLASTDHGTMILNRLDACAAGDGNYFGVGIQLMETSQFDIGEVELCKRLLESRREHFGDGVVAYDCGANIGTHTIPWAQHMRGWGTVVAIEAQERVFYALAGNIAINNCFNARAIWAVVGKHDPHDGSPTMFVPQLDHQKMASFGSLELRQAETNENIGQRVDYMTLDPVAQVWRVDIDSMWLPRLDFIKIDIEGMEMEALEGACHTIKRCKPIIMAEWLKVGKEALTPVLEGYGYKLFAFGLNVVAVHESDPTLENLKQGGAQSG